MYGDEIECTVFDDTFAMSRWMERDGNGEEYAANIRAKLWGHIQEIFKPRPRLRVDQASDLYRNIPASASADPGKFRVATYEIARGPMMAVTERGVSTITVAGPTQMLKTTFLESTAMYFMYVNPAPQVHLQANEKAAIDYSQFKIDSMINSTPVLRNIIQKQHLERKTYPGGFLKIANAGSPINMAMNPCMVAASDETDKMKALEDHGHPVYLIEKRLPSFGDRALALRTCSPTTPEGFIWKSFMAGDRRLPYVECPKCGHDHIMRWRTEDAHGGYQYHVHYDKDGSGKADPKSAAYVCPGMLANGEQCGHHWTEGERKKALSEVRWRQTRPFTCCDEHQDPQIEQYWDDSELEVDYAICKHCGKRAVSNSHASFNCSRLYSPKPLSNMVKSWVATFGNIAALADFIMNDLGEPWDDVKQITISGEGLRSKAEPYTSEVPDRAYLLTAGVDTQDDRLAVEVVAWGRHGESWSLHYEELKGDPKFQEVWNKLDALLIEKDWLTKSGEIKKIQAVCVDSQGHRQQYVYSHCAARRNLRWFAIAGKGGTDSGKELAQSWPGSPTRNNSQKIELWQIGTRRFKLQIMDMLMVEMPGPGFIHSPIDRPIEWYAGLISERIGKKPDGTIFFKLKDGFRNEPLDCRVYAMAALEALRSIKDPELGFGQYGYDFLEQLMDAEHVPSFMTDFEKQWHEARVKREGDSVKDTLAEAARKQIVKSLGILEKPQEQSKGSAFSDRAPPVVKRAEPPVAAKRRNDMPYVYRRNK